MIEMPRLGLRCLCPTFLLVAGPRPGWLLWLIIGAAGKRLPQTQEYFYYCCFSTMVDVRAVTD